MTGLTFRERKELVELMDDLDMGGPVMDQTLRQLSKVNRWLGGLQPTVKGIEALIANRPKLDRPISIADIGCGGGDTLRTLAQWGRNQQQSFSFTGIDANPHVVAYARQVSQDWPEIQYEVLNCLDPTFAQRRYDIISCNLFLHHFSESELATLLPTLGKMAELGLVVNDLHRHRLAWLGFAALTRLLGASYMIRHDGLVSIRRGFVRKELKALLEPVASSLITLQWRWAFRYLAIVPTQDSVI